MFILWQIDAYTKSETLKNKIKLTNISTNMLLVNYYHRCLQYNTKQNDLINSMKIGICLNTVVDNSIMLLERVNC